jgi:capsular polysaccharide transport system permease protein
MPGAKPMRRNALPGIRSQYLEGLATQRRIIGALLMREMQTRYGRENIGFLWFICEPLLFTFGVIGMWSLLPGGSDKHGIALATFLITGYMPLLLFRHINGRALAGVRSNSSLLYHRRITALDILLSRFLLEIAGALIAFVFGCSLLNILGFMLPPHDMTLLLLGWFYAVWFCCGLGLIIGALSEYSEVTEKIYSPMSYLMIPISGCFFMAAWAPAEYRWYLLLFPPVNYTEMIRGAWLGPSVLVYYDVLYLTEVCLVMTFVGLLLLSVTRKYVVFT